MSVPGEQDELRALVRELLREVLLQQGGPGPAAPAATEEAVQVRDDADLQRLVQRVLTLADDPLRGQDLRAGRLRFRLTGAADRRTTPATTGQVLRVERGAVTEAHIRRAAREQARVVVGRRAVLTPLAKDTARSSGVVVERER